MRITPYWTTGLASDLFNDIDHVFNRRSFEPGHEVSDTDDHFLLSIDLPGMKKDEIKIEVNNNTLSVSGERKSAQKSYGYFQRSFTLPSTVEKEKIEAKYEDGVLELYLPKSALAKPRQIEIQSGKTGIFEKLLGPKNHQALPT